MKRKSYIRQKKRQKRIRNIAFTVVAIISAIVVSFISLRLYAQIAGAPPLTVPKASVFLDSNGNAIGDHFISERRYWTELEDISPYLVKATIAVEDKDFYEHNGFDFSRIAGAILKDIKTRSMAEGASTLTQQYARNLYLSHEKTWARKIYEALYAYRLEIFYNKDEILEGYLNTVNYGHGMYGIEAASRYYFGKSANDLTLAESALLAGIPKGPSIYSPIIDLEKATGRQQLILGLMEDQKIISSAEKERAVTEEIVMKNEEFLSSKTIAPYFLDVVWQEATDILEKKHMNISEGGWVIKTTLNQAHQKAAEEAVAKNMPEGELQVGFVSMDVKTGQVTALVGGRDYGTSPFNRVTQAVRQPGSSIKPILYAAALEKGFSPLTYLDVGETIFTYDNGRSTYKPQNVNGQFADSAMSMAQAIAISDNIYAVKTLEEIGYDSFRDMLHRFNLNSTEKDNPSIALGTIENSLYTLTNAYNTIAAGGQERKATTILSIQDSNGDVVYEYEGPSKEQIISKENAFILTELMTGMFDPVFSDYSPSTGISIRPRMTHTYAAKSGSTISDQWIVGFSPSISAGVWNGYDQGKQLTVSTEMSAAKKVWIDFMEAVNAGTANENFDAPEGVEGVLVDIETGKLATDACPKQRLVYVKAEEVPTKTCTDIEFFKEDRGWGNFLDLFPFESFKGFFGG
ncbi:1A family penicillin-binding protein [Lysinibacillus composti]|uniref:PBP1A family penicillin-binding protein n=1 Tax=Lysinibacillus composti TaxID=720633 RepID=A0A3N9UHP3_9BACI|nr:PBP1A family penicillin-binding protein [Lysinibacillus composti]MBM7608987.1 1A family penicillin-binding protein [Lysinibacillus composti]RQW75590.1 PBP1A family penicillin-binding protein [Lysinibacillus composti]